LAQLLRLQLALGVAGIIVCVVIFDYEDFGTLISSGLHSPWVWVTQLQQCRISDKPSKYAEYHVCSMNNARMLHSASNAGKLARKGLKTCTPDWWRARDICIL